MNEKNLTLEEINTRTIENHKKAEIDIIDCCKP